MKTIISFLCIFVSFSIGIQADVYVKGILHIDGGYRYGYNVPDIDVVNEWWFGKDKVTFRSTGWCLDSFNTDFRFTLDKEKRRIIVVNLSQKSFVEVPLPMNLLSHIDQSIAERLNEYQINGTIKKTGEKQIVYQKVCDVYSVTERINRDDDHFYERDRTVKATCDIPFDWQMINELYQWIRSFFYPQKSYLSELENIKGFILEENNVFFELAGQVTWSFKVLEISQIKASPYIYDVPKDYKKKQKFTMLDLIYIRLIMYPYPIY